MGACLLHNLRYRSGLNALINIIILIESEIIDNLSSALRRPTDTREVLRLPVQLTDRAPDDVWVDAPVRPEAVVNDFFLFGALVALSLNSRNSRRVIALVPSTRVLCVLRLLVPVRRGPVLELRSLPVSRLGTVHLLGLSRANSVRAQRRSVRRVQVVGVVVAGHPLVEGLLLRS